MQLILVTINESMKFYVGCQNHQTF